MAQKLPIGYDDFQKVIEGGFVYVDKTLLAEEVLDQSAEVLLITRPRRFGKTLNMSMLAHFFDNRRNSGALFRGLAIEQRPCFQLQGSFPVLFLSFKDLKAQTYAVFLGLFRDMIKKLYRAYADLADHLSDMDRSDFLAIARGESNEAELMGALQTLTQYLAQHHGKQVVLLLDEYDTPIHEGYAAGYYDEVIGFMRGVLGRLLKGNAHLEKAVLTGILRVAKESIFSDLNNVVVYSLLDPAFADKFGFTEPETEHLLERAGLQDRLAEVRDWYNGYLVGTTKIYNPWSLLNFLNAADQGCRPYWVNTSANLLVHDQLLHADSHTQDALKSLLNGTTVETSIQDQTVLRDIKQDESLLWSFLLFSGYLTVQDWTQTAGTRRYRLKIPNGEVMLLFQDIIQGWLRRELGSTPTQELLRGLIEADTELFAERLAELVAATLSYYDTAGKNPERVYHTFVLGLLAHLSDRYVIRSNREAGMGRSDVMLLPKHAGDRGVIMEFKTAERPDQLEAALDAAHAQMQTRHYAGELVTAGVHQYSEIAVACCGKQVAVRARHLVS